MSAKRINGILKPLLLVFFLAFACMCVPVEASSQRFVAVSCCGFTSLALDENGNVWLWGEVYEQKGSPAYNQCPDQYVEVVGDIYRRVQTTPVKLPLNDVIAISGSNMALKKDGTVWTWGPNDRGQCGDGTNVSTSTPVKVKGLDHVIAISSGASCLALKDDGTVWTWGRNDRGQCGDGTLIDRWEPVQVKGLSNVTAIYGGAFAIKDDGTVWTWGASILDVDENGKPIDYYTRGQHKPNCKPTPFKVEWAKNVRSIDFSLDGSTFVKDDGTVWAWGNDMWGRLGNGRMVSPLTTPDIRYLATPVQVKGLNNVKTVATNMLYSMALKEDGTVWAWGHNYGGQFGTGERNTTEALPIRIPGLDGIIAIACGDHRAVFLKSDGSVWFSGLIDPYNDTAVTTPTRILGPSSIVPTGTATIQPASNQNATIQPISTCNNSSTPINLPLNAILLGTFAIILIGGAAYLLILRKR
ncbi:RCC1 domain-containing protein [Methanocella conradii]|uniref:RCC1 domain-containing protein n=1 Tax=Methanocella conradii TaxID=1175444 RepID=UPI00157E26F1|nr:hypothetical protein [Methanocella conradii]